MKCSFSFSLGHSLFYLLGRLLVDQFCSLWPLPDLTFWNPLWRELGLLWSLVFWWHWEVTCIWCFSWIFALFFDAFYKVVKCCFVDSGGLINVAVPFTSESYTLRGTYPSHPSLGSGWKGVGQNDRRHLIIPMAGFSVEVKVFSSEGVHLVLIQASTVSVLPSIPVSSSP